MKQVNYYKVAEHIFSVSSTYFSDNYAPFAVDQADNTLFTLDVINQPFTQPFTQELTQNDEGQKIICGHLSDGKQVFEFWLEDSKAGVLICSNDYRQNTLYMYSGYERFATDNALMIIFALATATESTLLFHSSVIGYQGKAYMFLGKSGTGKSTHSRLWLNNIEGAFLLNDDNPAVRIFPDGIKVFGTPWSGKTDCYINQNLPLGAIVSLSQAPQNRITPLHTIMAYAALVPSVSGKRWDKAIADSLHATENAIIKHIKMWHLECLPDANAAHLCQQTISCQ